VALLGDPILVLWLGSDFSGYGGLVALLVLAAIVDLPSYAAAAVLQSIERHGPIAKMALGSGVANLALSIALVGPFGVEGVAAGTLVASTIEIGVFVVPYAARVLGVPAREFLGAVVAPLVLPALALIAVIEGGRALIDVGTLAGLGAVSLAGMGGFALVYAALGASPRERASYRAAGAAVLGWARPRPRGT
jgi:O-antigen/teichoic acid export membrane protein